MPYVTNVDDEDKKQNGTGQGPITPGGANNTVQLSPNSGIGSTGVNPSSGGATQTGGQFASLDKYVNANQGQAQPLANKITSGISNQYNDLSGQNASTLQGVQGKVDQGYTKQNQAILDQESANPVSFASDANNVNAFQGQLNNKYTGPGSAESDADYQTQLGKVNQAIATGKAQTGSDAGRQQLLKQYEAKPTAGVTGLNSAILSKDPNAQAGIEQAYSPFSNLVSGLSSGAADINSKIGTAQTEASNSAAQANKQIQDQTNALNTNVNNELKTAQDKYKNFNDTSSAMAANLQQGKLPEGYGVDAGLQSFITNNINPWATAATPALGVPSYNFSNALPQIPTAAAPTLNQAATSSDFNTYGALNNILGSQIASPLSGLDPTQAGSYTTPSIPNVNNQALAGDIYDSLSGFGGNTQISTPAFKQYGTLLAALDKYLGKANPMLTDPYYTQGPGKGTIPTIA